MRNAIRWKLFFYYKIEHKLLLQTELNLGLLMQIKS